MEMTPKERLDAFYRGEKTDRLPNLTIIGSVVTQYGDINVEQYCKDWEAMTRASIRCSRDLKLDFVQIASDLDRAAEGYGSRINFYPDRLPSVAEPALEDISEVEDLKPLKCRDIPRLFDLVRATELCLKECDEIWPMTLATGPMTVASNIRGVEDIMMDSLTDVEYTEQLLDLATDTIIDFIDELAAVGAKYVYIADPVASIMTPGFYRNSVLPRQKRIFAEMEKCGIQGRLHMCGNTLPIIADNTSSGAKIVDVDNNTDFREALKHAQPGVVLNGNIHTANDVYNCSPAETKQAILRCARIAREVGRRTMFMPGCELATDTKRENILAIHEALEEIGMNDC